MFIWVSTLIGHLTCVMPMTLWEISMDIKSYLLIRISPCCALFDEYVIVMHQGVNVHTFGFAHVCWSTANTVRERECYQFYLPTRTHNWTKEVCFDGSILKGFTIRYGKWLSSMTTTCQPHWETWSNVWSHNNLLK